MGGVYLYPFTCSWQGSPARYGQRLSTPTSSSSGLGLFFTESPLLIGQLRLNRRFWLVSVITLRTQVFEKKHISRTQFNPYFFPMHFKTDGWNWLSWEKLMISQESFCRQIRRICLNWYDSSCVAATAWLVAYLPSRAAATPTPALFHTHSPMIICWIWFLSCHLQTPGRLPNSSPLIFCPVCCLLGLFLIYKQRPSWFCLSLVQKWANLLASSVTIWRNPDPLRSCVYCLLAIGDSWRRGALSRHCSWCLFIFSAWRTLNIEEHCVVNVQILQLMFVYCSSASEILQRAVHRWPDS